MIYTTYNPDTGEIYNTITSSDATTTPDTSNFILGAYDSQTYFVENGQAVELPPNPSNECLKYYFDYTSKSWVLDQITSSFLTRDVRNKLLNEIDRINPIWYASLTADQQQELIAYRQALLAVPQQSGFPETVTWPVKPTWL